MNTNCLIGIKCPSCGSEGPFIIEVRTQVLMYDNGSEDCDSDNHWDSLSYMRCYECDRDGQAREFFAPEKSEIQTFADTILRVVSGQTEEQAT